MVDDGKRASDHSLRAAAKMIRADFTIAALDERHRLIAEELGFGEIDPLWGAPGPVIAQYNADGMPYLARTLGIDWHRNRGVIRCPAHDDAKPSLSYRWTETGGLLLHCHAGCTFDEIRNAVKGNRP